MDYNVAELEYWDTEPEPTRAERLADGLVLLSEDDTRHDA